MGSNEPPKKRSVCFRVQRLCFVFAFFFLLSISMICSGMYVRFFLSRFGDEKKNHQSAIKTIEKVNKNGK